MVTPANCGTSASKHSRSHQAHGHEDAITRSCDTPRRPDHEMWARSNFRLPLTGSACLTSKALSRVRYRACQGHARSRLGSALGRDRGVSWGALRRREMAPRGLERDGPATVNGQVAVPAGGQEKVPTPRGLWVTCVACGVRLLGRRGCSSGGVGRGRLGGCGSGGGRASGRSAGSGSGGAAGMARCPLGGNEMRRGRSSGRRRGAGSESGSGLFHPVGVAVGDHGVAVME